MTPLLRQPATNQQIQAPELIRKMLPSRSVSREGCDCFSVFHCCACRHDCPYRIRLSFPFIRSVRNRFSGVTGMRTPRRFHSRQDAGRGLKESSFESVFLGGKVLESGRTVCRKGD